jgi:DNA-binding transcriptional LysR family regulator
MDGLGGRPKGNGFADPSRIWNGYFQTAETWDGSVQADVGLRRRGQGGRFLGRLAPPGMHPVAEAIADGQLIAVLAEYESGSLPVYIVLPPGNSFPIKLRAFLDFTMARLGSRLRSLA